MDVVVQEPLYLDAPEVIIKIFKILDMNYSLEDLQEHTLSLKRCLQSDFVETREITDLIERIDENCRAMQKHRIRTNLQSLLSLLRPIDNVMLLTSLRQNVLTSGLYSSFIDSIILKFIVFRCY